MTAPHSPQTPKQYRFDTLSSTVLSTLRSNATLILVMVVSLAVLSGGFFGYKYWQDMQTLSRQNELAKIFSSYFDSKQKNDTESSKLDEQINALKTAKDNKNAPAEIAALEQKKSALSVRIGTLQKAAEDFLNKYPKANESSLAALVVAHAFLESKDLAQARTLFEAASESARKHSNQALVVTAQISLSQLDIHEKKYPEALKRMDDLLPQVSEALKPQIFFMKAQIHYLAGQYDQVKTSIEGLEKDFKDAAETKKAKALLALIQQGKAQ